MQKFTRIAGLIASASTLLFLLPRAPSQSQTASSAAGRASIIKSCSPAFDLYTDAPTPAQQRWIQQHYTKMLVFSPYFDTRTSWYAKGLLYIDSYAIYTGSVTGDLDIPKIRPEWLLRDSAGNPLYIPWGCDPARHVCPQYAADISNPAYRQWWVDQALSELGHGAYAGLWIDDVNLDWRISNGDGNPVVPVDYNTGALMNIADWRRYFAEFLEKIRGDISGIEIVHNSIWYAGAPARDADSYVQREITAADTINIEHGVTDAGLTGGTGPFSLEALLSFIERVNQKGKRVYIGGLGPEDPHDAVAAEYTLACYFLVSNGLNAIADAAFSTPDNWWPGFDTDLGTPLDSRQTWNGLMRRDFANGIVLVNAPHAASITPQLPAPMHTLDGRTVTSVRIDGGHGVVLLR